LLLPFHSTVEHKEKRHFDLFGMWILGVQAVLIVLFYVFATYGDAPSRGVTVSPAPTDVVVYWQFMRDVAVMIFIGFAYLMTFLKVGGRF
jgi:hypothetical protein